MPLGKGLPTDKEASMRIQNWMVHAGGGGVADIGVSRRDRREHYSPFVQPLEVFGKVTTSG